jgi:hypothetical protein
MTAGFFVFGLSIIALALGLYRSLSRGSRVGTLLLVIVGLAIFASGLFPTDLQGATTTDTGGIHNMLFLVIFLALIVSYIFARLEIEIEGPFGWAEKLPTWRVSNRWTKIFYGSRPLTGYHLWMQLFVVLLVHIPVAFDFAGWTWGHELQAIAFIILFFIIEDFLWFVLNSAFGVRRFRKEHIWWHAPHWWWIMPRDYWIFFLVAVAFYAWGSQMRHLL